jgi:hypothetical protein
VELDLGETLADVVDGFGEVEAAVAVEALGSLREKQVFPPFRRS